MFSLLRQLDWSEIKSWDVLEKAIGCLPTQQHRGEAFEEFCAALLELNKEYYQANAVWRFRNIPDEILKRLGCSNRQDLGIDGVILHYDDTVTAYQSKFRLLRSDTPSQRELSTFYMVSDRADFRLIISNVEDLPRVARERKAHGQCLVDSLLNLSEDFFATLQEYVLRQKRRIEVAPQPRLFQQHAINAVVDGFSEHRRGQAILPCGSGKTLVGKWIADRLGAKRILIMVPSLALIKQTLEEWHRARGSGFRYICVCSDQSVASLHSADGWEADPSDQDFRVSTDSKEMVAFLSRPTSLPQVVFSTYQSSSVLVSAMGTLSTDHIRFDLAICDEAHKVAGVAGKPFAQILSDKSIPADRRLFMTATPRVIAPQYRRTTAEDETPIVSMDEEDVFGPVFYRMSFAEAIQQSIIADYRVVVIGVSEKEVAELARAQRTIETEDEEQWDAAGLAQRIALGKAISHYGIKKIFSFHNRVSNASDFVDASRPDSLPAVLDKLTPELHYMAKHINGEMPAGERNRILREFQLSVRGVVSNARCLGEGVNVPAVEGVFFADSRSSVIDIVQATGRALRNAPGKSMAYVIVPVLVQEEEDPESIIEASRFELVWQVLSAMASQDERVEGAIQEARIRQGEGRAPVLGQTPLFDRRDLPDANTFLVGFPTHIAFSEYQKLFSLEMMERLGTRWHLRFGALKKYMEKYGKEPEKDAEYAGFKIGAWLEAQRAAYRKGKLLNDREELLDQLGVHWGSYKDTERSWIHHMAACSAFWETNGKLPAQGDESPEGLKIGVWLNHQRRLFRKGALPEERKTTIQNLLGDALSPQQSKWDRNYKAYKEYVETKGKQPERRTVHNVVAIGNWLCNTIRPGKDKLPVEAVRKLDELGVVWESKRDRNYKAYKDYVETTGKQPERRTVHNGVAIGNWLCNTIRPGKDKLPAETVRKLDELGVVWEEMRWKSPSVRASETEKGEPQEVESQEVEPIVDTWLRNFELCRDCMKGLSGKMKIADMYNGNDVGFWFHMQIGPYAAGVFPDLKRRLFSSLMLLDASHGSHDREWNWRYSHCLESVVLRGVLPSKDKEMTLAFSKDWFAKQVELFRNGSLCDYQKTAIKELLAIAENSRNGHSAGPEGSSDIG